MDYKVWRCSFLDKKVLLFTLGVLMLVSVPTVLAAENYTIFLDSIYSETEAGLSTLLYADCTRDSGDNDGDNVTFTIDGCAFTWNSISEQYEGVTSEATPQTITFNTIDVFASTEFVGETSSINQTVAVTWTTGTLELWQSELANGNWVGGLFDIMFVEITQIGGWSLMMAIFSIGVYNYSGPYAVFAIWMLGWFGFSTQVHGIALIFGVFMTNLGWGLALAKVLIDSRKS